LKGGRRYGRGRGREGIGAGPPPLTIPHKKIWVDYDEEADVLYVNFKRPSRADDSELTDDDVIIRRQKGEVVGMTFLNVAKRFGTKSRA